MHGLNAGKTFKSQRQAVDNFHFLKDIGWLVLYEQRATLLEKA